MFNRTMTLLFAVFVATTDAVLIRSTRTVAESSPSDGSSVDPPPSHPTVIERRVDPTISVRISETVVSNVAAAVWRMRALPDSMGEQTLKDVFTISNFNISNHLKSDTRSWWSSMQEAVLTRLHGEARVAVLEAPIAKITPDGLHVTFPARVALFAWLPGTGESHVHLAGFKTDVQVLVKPLVVNHKLSIELGNLDVTDPQIELFQSIPDKYTTVSTTLRVISSAMSWMGNIVYRSGRTVITYVLGEYVQSKLHSLTADQVSQGLDKVNLGLQQLVMGLRLGGLRVANLDGALELALEVLHEPGSPQVRLDALDGPLPRLPHGPMFVAAWADAHPCEQVAVFAEDADADVLCVRDEENLPIGCFPPEQLHLDKASAGCAELEFAQFANVTNGKSVANITDPFSGALHRVAEPFAGAWQRVADPFADALQRATSPFKSAEFEDGADYEELE